MSERSGADLARHCSMARETAAVMLMSAVPVMPAQMRLFRRSTWAGAKATPSSHRTPPTPQAEQCRGNVVVVNRERSAQRPVHDRNGLFGNRHLKFVTGECLVTPGFVANLAQTMGHLRRPQLVDSYRLH